ncbi:DedA family protein [Salipiger mangrovisoli]|uniref:DedA family protein n=1 Tax=Salipiger mangrovisoli TaxID=2865933 RepID=A0ABR9X4L9_9RHOB|nr:DedA family protein [Salipiger mangrovisoli]MBE9638461.1 DedA family protein [Salipiger mangrovisoli]
MFDWISGFIDAVGAFGIGLLMFLENVFPPIPSELIMPLGGFNAAAGREHLFWVVLAGSLGSLAGAVFWYWIGRRLGTRRLKRLAARHGRWLTILPEDLDRSNDWFTRHGGSAVLIGRMIPTVRTFISVPAGVARMPMASFLAFSAVGTVSWTTLLAMAGYLLQAQYGLVAGWLDPVSTVVVAGIVGLYLWRVATYGRRKRRKAAGG